MPMRFEASSETACFPHGETAVTAVSMEILLALNADPNIYEAFSDTLPRSEKLLALLKGDDSSTQVIARRYI
jgi:hypothetical protein